jgi:hypothetical protein
MQAQAFYRSACGGTRQLKLFFVLTNLCMTEPKLIQADE